MTESREAALWGLVAARAARVGRHVSVADVCAVTIGALQVSGTWATVAAGRGPDMMLCTTSAACERLAELQLVLGEGPCHDAAATGAPVLTADLGDEESGRRWPAFTVEARQAGAGAVFAFPLTVGAIRAGVMGLYRGSPGPLDGSHFGDGLLLADAATMLLLDAAKVDPGRCGRRATAGTGPAGQSAELALRRAEIDQATGMLTVQLGVSAAEAFARLRAYAYSSDRRLAEVAGDIVARQLRLHPDPPMRG